MTHEAGVTGGGEGTCNGRIIELLVRTEFVAAGDTGASLKRALRERGVEPRGGGLRLSLRLLR